MRRAACLVLLTLLSPATASVICGATCLDAARAIAVSKPASCHGLAADDEREVVSADGVCHDQPMGTVTAIAKIEPQRLGFVLLPAPSSPRVVAPRTLTGSPSSLVALPDPPPTPTPLRI